MNSYKVDRDKWATLTIFEQMGNIYVEVGRTFNAKKSGDSKKSEAAMIRALDLFDASAEVASKSNSPKLKEILTVREIFADDYSNSADSTLNDYLMQFALVARLKK